MSIKAWNALLVIALLIVLSGGGYILYQNNQQKQAEIAQKMAEAEALKAEQEAALKAEFDDFLKTFLADIRTHVADYKKQRKVLESLSKPTNLRQAEYVEENARLAESTMMGLQLQMETVMGLFEKADEDIQGLIGKFTEEQQVLVTKQWEKLRDENIEKFTLYFTTEQDLMMANLALVEFYNTHRDVMEVDVINERVIFDTVELQQQEAMLRGKILELKTARKDLFRKQGG